MKATLEILRESGYDQTYVQDVSKRSGVALGTIYSHFRSKDFLIYLASERWVAETIGGALPVDSHDSMEDRMSHMIRHSASLLFAEPKVLQAWIRANLSNDADVVERVKSSKRFISLSMYPATAFSSEQLAEDMVLIMEHVWFTGIVRWSLGQKEASDVPRDVERAMLLVFQAHRAMSESR